MQTFKMKRKKTLHKLTLLLVFTTELWKKFSIELIHQMNKVKKIQEIFLIWYNKNSVECVSNTFSKERSWWKFRFVTIFSMGIALRSGSWNGKSVPVVIGILFTCQVSKKTNTLNPKTLKLFIMALTSKSKWASVLSKTMLHRLSSLRTN